jgi:hypothetical protein
MHGCGHFVDNIVIHPKRVLFKGLLGIILSYYGYIKCN